MRKSITSMAGRFLTIALGGISCTIIFNAAAFAATFDLSWSTFLGGGNEDIGFDIACDSSNCAYVAGKTGSVQFPVTSGVFIETYSGIADAFVAKLDPTGTELVYSTFLGGGHYDQANAVTVDSAGCVYVTGYTYATDYPVTSGAFDETYNGEADIFITKLNDNGSGLEYSTYLGGTGGDYGRGIDIDSAGCAFITGGISSSDLPTSSGTFSELSIGGGDTFVTKLNSAGTELTYSTYLGGSGLETGYRIQVDDEGNAYLTGYTYSSDFPVTPGAFDTIFNGAINGFVVKLNSSGSGLEYSTFLGGGSEYVHAIDLDSAGCAYIVGTTNSSEFPVTSGVYAETYHGGWDSFISKLNIDGTGLVYSTFLGGSNIDCNWAIAVDSAGCAYVSGETESADFPCTSGAYDETYDGNTDSYITIINADGSTLEYSTFLGGSSYEVGFGIVCNSPGSAFVTGKTGSSDFPITIGTFDESYNENVDVFVTKLSSGHNLSGTITFAYPGLVVDSTQVTYQVRNTGLPPANPFYTGIIDVTITPGNPAAGTFIITDVKDGTYDVALKHGNHIADMTINVLVFGGDVTGLNLTLWPGDADGNDNSNDAENGDNDVDSYDYYLLYKQYLDSISIAAGKGSDFDCDSDVDFYDYCGLYYGYVQNPHPGNWYFR